MAQPINYYQQLITDAYVSNAASVGVTLTPALWSAVNLDRCVIYAVAVCAWTIDNLCDLFKADVNETISLLKPHSLRWYASIAEAFQYGYNLVAESDYYNNTGIDADLIAASKVVGYAAVVEQTRGLRIKVAKDNGTDLEPLTTPELNSFIYYMKQVKDAGVRLLITTAVADSLQADITIVYNPLVLTATGARIDGTNATPVQTAIALFLKNLPFNGVFSIQKFVDTIQLVEGVADLRINGISARYGALPFTSISITYVPDAGYLRIVSGDLTINFLPA